MSLEDEDDVLGEVLCPVEEELLGELLVEEELAPVVEFAPVVELVLDCPATLPVEEDDGDVALEDALVSRPLSWAEGLLLDALGVAPEFCWLLLPALVVASPVWLPVCDM